MDAQLESLQGPAEDLPEAAMQNEREVVRRAGRQAISAFLDGHNCFSVLRASGKVVVFDTRIPIQLAFYALVEHGEYFKLSLCKVRVVWGWGMLSLDLVFPRTKCTRAYVTPSTPEYRKTLVFNKHFKLDLISHQHVASPVECCSF